MSVTDFLFEGKAPTPVTLTGTSTVQLPEWYTQYTTDMLGRAQGVANLPYAMYPGPRIAGFTPGERTGFEATKTAATAYQPFLTGTAETLGKAGEVSPLGVAQPYLGAAAKTFPSAVQEYMNPYTQNVVNQIAEQGVRQLQEKYLPAVGQEFIQAGQFGVGPGSTRMGEFGARALRDVQEAVLAEQSKALQAGYGQAADIFASDVGRQAQLAGTAGQLGIGEAQALRDLASRYGETAGEAQRLGLTGAEAITGVGTKERAMQQANLDLAYQDFLRQEGYPKEQIKFLSDVLSGVQIPKTEISTQQQIPSEDVLETGLSKAANTYKVLDEILKGSSGSSISDLLKKYFGGG
jgi:hypothetical protein